MVTPSEGSVVLVRFPFSDLSSSKLRPAVVLAFTGRDDWILCQVTSNPYSDPTAIQLSKENLENLGSGLIELAGGFYHEKRYLQTIGFMENLFFPKTH